MLNFANDINLYSKCSVLVLIGTQAQLQSLLVE